ncbi:hypothetical protein [Ilumatobacter nonamiensis]|uniref:hypothetical protein n=1 Tax=Ilumatobacter nonamiensis TaxID=467093 RepID=UPI0003453EC0|nr:hypothetical protein [Ilumatobacter nonamiensis]
MIRARSTPIPLAIAALVALTAGCSQIAERATEEAVERAVESGSGDDVDIDFSDGEVSIESEEGNLTINADENGVEIDGTDADGNDFSLNADENGLEADSDEAGSFDVDADGSFTATDEDGEVTTGDIDVDGENVDLDIDGVEGESVFNTGEGIPDQWPSGVPEPDGIDDVFGTYVAEAGEESFVVAGSADGSAEEVFDDYVGRLTEAGYEETSSANQGDQFRTATFANGESTVAVTTQWTGETTELIVLVDRPASSAGDE